MIVASLRFPPDLSITDFSCLSLTLGNGSSNHLLYRGLHLTIKCHLVTGASCTHGQRWWHDDGRDEWSWDRRYLRSPLTVILRHSVQDHIIPLLTSDHQLTNVQKLNVWRSSQRKVEASKDEITRTVLCDGHHYYCILCLNKNNNISRCLKSTPLLPCHCPTKASTAIEILTWESLTMG